MKRQKKITDEAPEVAIAIAAQWVGARELATLLGVHESTIGLRIRSKGIDSVKEMDPRILEAKQVIGSGRSGKRSKFLWKNDGARRERKVGYFSVHKNESEGAIVRRKQAIRDFADKIGLKLYDIYYDVIGDHQKALTLVKISTNPLVETIVVDQEFSLGGVHYEFAKQFLLSMGINIICVPGMTRLQRVIEDAYIGEVNRLLLHLQLMGLPIQEAHLSLSKRFREVRDKEGDQVDPGIT